MIKYATLPRKTITIEEAARLAIDDAWVAQQKFDGRRILVDINKDHVHINNRLGEHSSWTSHILDQLGDWFYSISNKNLQVVFDGEWVDDTYHVFDLKSCDLHTEEDPYYLRWANLRGFLSAFDRPESIEPVYTAFAEEDKLELIKQAHNHQAEGIVFRKYRGMYIPGRADNIKKFKFVRSLDAVVMGHIPGRKSVKVGLVDTDKVFEIGHCSTTFLTGVNVGDVVEIQYLYFSKHDRLVQPILQRVREDKDVTECTFDQVDRYQSNEVVKL